jgi:hypothetical protein
MTLFIENRAFYAIMWKIIVEPDRPQTTIWRTRIACQITKATNSHAEYVIIFPFPPQKWLHERPSMLRYKYFACLLVTQFNTNEVIFVYVLISSNRIRRLVLASIMLCHAFFGLT